MPSENMKKRIFNETLRMSSRLTVDMGVEGAAKVQSALNVLAVAASMEDNEASRLINVARSILKKSSG